MLTAYFHKTLNFFDVTLLVSIGLAHFDLASNDGRYICKWLWRYEESKNLKKNMNLILYNSKTILLLDESTAVQFWMVAS